MNTLRFEVWRMCFLEENQRFAKAYCPLLQSGRGMYMRTITMKTADSFEIDTVYGTRRFHSQNYGNIKKTLDAFKIII
jgi:hypothetical protein